MSPHPHFVIHFLSLIIRPSNKEREINHLSPARKRMKESNSPKWEQSYGDLNNIFSSNVQQTTRALPNQTVHWTTHNSKPMVKTW